MESGGQSVKGISGHREPKGEGCVYAYLAECCESSLDIYQAVETSDQGELFNFHEKPNPNCPVGKNIHRILGESLLAVQKKFEEELKEHSVAEVYERMDKA